MSLPVSRPAAIPAPAPLAQTGRAPKPVVRLAAAHDTSPPLSSLASKPAAAPNADIVRNRHIPRPIVTPTMPITDPVVQPVIGVTTTPTTPVNFEGLFNSDVGPIPPDTDGAVGLNHYLQVVNMNMQVFDKQTGASLFGPAPINALWSGFGGPCDESNDGDPIVLYDRPADRWLVSQFANVRTSGPYYECIAVSATPDPTGAYHRYAFQYSDTLLNDYPKLGVWPDGYYMAANQFGDVYFGASGVVVYERDRMLAGQLARQVYFDAGAVDPAFTGLLPADWDGYTAPPAGAPGLFAAIADDTWEWPADQLQIWTLHVDWTDPDRSTFGVNGQPDWTLPTAPFNSNLCDYNLDCLPQPDTSAGLDALSDRLMFRLAYRNFGAYESLVVNHTVNVDGAGHAGVRWYELRRSGANWSIDQQGAFAPDAANRWMGSLAQDAEGNLALGYTAASQALYPSIRYTGRLAGDPAGVMTLGEATVVAGGGSQINSRWGDYSAMTVDPVDDCTFWYTNEYYAATASRAWRTRIAAFRLPGCERGLLSGVVTDAVTLAPVGGATVQVSGPAPEFTAVSSADGVFRANARAGVYTVTVSAAGYSPAVISGVAVLTSGVTALPVLLAPQQNHVVSGTVVDQASGNPISSTLSVIGYPRPPHITATATVSGSGFYSLSLTGGQIYTLTAAAYGHRAEVRPLGTLDADRTEDFALWRAQWLLLVFRP